MIPNKGVQEQQILNLLAEVALLRAIIPPSVGSGSVFVFQPGGAASGNTFTSFAALYAAYNSTHRASSNGTRPPVTIQIDDSFVSPAVIPAGAYNLDSVTFTGIANETGPFNNAQVTISAGVTITAGVLAFAGVTVAFAGAAACISCSSATQAVNIQLLYGAALYCSGVGPFLSVTAGQAYVRVDAECDLGALGHAVVAATGGACSVFSSGIFATLGAGAVTGTTAVVFYDVTVPGAQGGGVAVNQAIGYAPAVPGNWSPAPTLMAPALDQLAARPIAPAAGTAATVIGGQNYFMAATDTVIRFDTSNGLGTATANMTGASFIGQRITFYWWAWGGGQIPPTIQGVVSGAKIAPFGGQQASGAAGLVGSTNITTPGASFTLEWTGTEWASV